MCFVEREQRARVQGLRCIASDARAYQKEQNVVFYSSVYYFADITRVLYKYF